MGRVSQRRKYLKYINCGGSEDNISEANIFHCKSINIDKCQIIGYENYKYGCGSGNVSCKGGLIIL